MTSECLWMYLVYVTDLDAKDDARAKVTASRSD